MKTKSLSKPMNKFLPLLITVLFALLLSACSSTQNADSDAQAADISTPVISNNGVTVEGRLNPVDSVWVSFQTSGEIAEIKVKENQSVTKGDILMVLSNQEVAQSDLKAAELELLIAQQALDDLNQTAKLDETKAHQALVEAELNADDAYQMLSDMDTEAYQESIDEAWTTVQEKQDVLDDAQEYFDKYKDLSEDNLTRQDAQTDLENAQKDYEDAVRAHNLLVYGLEQAQTNADNAGQVADQARQDYEDIQNGPDPDRLALANAQVDSAQAHVNAAQKALDAMVLSAPFDGVVTSIDATIGQVVSAKEPILHLADFSSWVVETVDLDEIKAVKIDSGKPVTLTVDALPGLELHGTVEWISLDYTEKSGDILYSARIRLDDSDPRLRWGMTMSVIFED